MRRGALALGVLGALAMPGQGIAQGGGVAVWCAPMIVTTLLARAPQCGRAVSAEARARAAQIVDAATAATERLQGPDAAAAMRAEVEAAATSGFDPATGCGALGPFLVILDRLDSDRGDAMVADQRAHAARATTLDGRCL